MQRQGFEEAQINLGRNHFLAFHGKVWSRVIHRGFIKKICFAQKNDLSYLIFSYVGI